MSCLHRKIISINTFLRTTTSKIQININFKLSLYKYENRFKSSGCIKITSTYNLQRFALQVFKPPNVILLNDFWVRGIIFKTFNVH